MNIIRNRERDGSRPVVVSLSRQSFDGFKAYVQTYEASIAGLNLPSPLPNPTLEARLASLSLDAQKTSQALSVAIDVIGSGGEIALRRSVLMNDNYHLRVPGLQTRDLKMAYVADMIDAMLQPEPIPEVRATQRAQIVSNLFDLRNAVFGLGEEDNTTIYGAETRDNLINSRARLFPLPLIRL